MHTIALAAMAACISLPIYWPLKARRKKPTPPGPPGRWLIGNLWDIPPRFAWIEFSRWKELYGDVVYVHALGQAFVVLNSLDAVADLIDGRSANYSDRPTLTMLGELVGINNFMFQMQYGDEWRYHRRLTHAALNTDAVKQYEDMQKGHVRDCLSSILERPQDFVKALHLAVGRITVSVAYGLSNEKTDMHVKAAEEAMDMVSQGIVPGRFLVDALPFLKHIPMWIPGSPRRFATIGQAQLENMLGPPVTELKAAMASGSFTPSYTSDLIQKLDADPGNMSPMEIEHILKWSAGDIFSAGVETNYATVLSFLLAMALNPAVQKKAQAEVDRVIPAGRLPTLADFDDLPYTMAVIKETLRWRPAAPLSLPRRSREADVYNGMYIPKHAIIMPNIWQISRTECGAFPPEDFVPERFLASGDNDPLPADPFTYVFGFGKRSCPGRRLGLSNVQLFVSTLLCTFDILPPVDSNGKPILPDPEFASGIISNPLPFEAVFRPRSKQALDLLRET